MLFDSYKPFPISNKIRRQYQDDLESSRFHERRIRIYTSDIISKALCIDSVSAV